VNTLGLGALRPFPTPEPSVPVNGFMEGAITIAAFAVAVFFLRYWKATSDRLFAVFAIAFTLFGASSIALFLTAHDPDGEVWVFALRAATFAALIVAVLDKNLTKQPARPQPAPDDRSPLETEAPPGATRFITTDCTGLAPDRFAAGDSSAPNRRR
jgi:hypothetical protein